MKGCEFAEDGEVTDFILNEETGYISAVICGGKVYDADAVILAVGISTLQDLIKNRYVVLQLTTFHISLLIVILYINNVLRPLSY